MKTIALLVLTIFCSSALAKDARTIGDILTDIKKRSVRVKTQKKRIQLPSYKPKTVYRAKRIKVNVPTRYEDPQSDEAQLSEINDEEIKQLVKLSNKYRKSKTRGEIWLRLAEAYVDKAKNIENQIQLNYDKKMEAFQQGKRKSRPRLNLDPSMRFNREAIKLYELFVKDFPKDEKIPQALFFLGYNYYELEEFNKGNSYYDLLIRKYPKSRYVQEAYFAKAEFYFENEKWAEATPNYKQVARRKRGRLYSFALYKLAWCYYKSGNIDKGLAYLERVIKIGQSKKSNSRAIRLVDEAKVNIIPFFADKKDYKRAEAYFNRFFKAKVVDEMLERLAYVYVDMGKTEAARYTFQKLINNRPYHPKAYDYQYQIVTMYSTQNQVKQFRKELFSWVDAYGPNSRWAKRNEKKSPALVAKSIELVETTLRTFTLQSHQTAQNSRGKTSRRLAESGYDTYFKNFGDSKFAGDMRFYYAELLYDMGKYAKATSNYLWVSENAPKSKYYEQSVLNAILSIEKSLPDQKSINKVVGKSDVPIALDKNSKMFEKVAKKYFEIFPKSKNTVEVKFKLASLYYSYNQYDKAVPIYMDIIKNHSDSKLAQNSGHIVLDIYNGKENFQALEDTADEILAIPALAGTKFGREIRAIKEKTTFKRAQQVGDSGDKLTVAQKNQKFAQDNPDSNLRVGALFNSAINFEKAGKLLPAIAGYEAIIASRKGKKLDSLKKQSHEFIANLYEKTGQYKKAAEKYEYLARTHKKPDYYFNAAAIRAGIQWYKAAIKNYLEYYRLEKKKEREEAYFQIAKLEEKRRRYSSALKYYEKYMALNPARAEGVVEAAFKIGNINERLGRKSKRDKWYKRTIAVQKALARKNKGLGVRYAAEAKFKLTYDLYKNMRKIRISGSSANQGRALKKKIGQIEKLKKELAKVIKYNDGYQIVASLATIGQAYQHLSASIYRAPKPKGLNKKEMTMYLQGIDKVAKPFKDNAEKNYEAAIQKAYEFEAYNKWAKVAFSENYRLKNGKKYSQEFVPFLTKLMDDLKNTSGGSKASDELIENLNKAVESKNEDDIVSASAAILSEDENDIYALNTLALFHYGKREYGLTKILLGRILDANKNHPVALNNLAVTYLSEGDLRKAIDHFRLSMRSDNDYVISPTNLASIYLEYQDYRRALPPLEEGYRLVKGGLGAKNKRSIEVTNNYAIALTGNEKIGDAEGIYEDLVEADGRNITVLRNYAVLLMRYAKKKDKALDQITRIKVYSTDKKVLKELKELEKEGYEISN